MCIIQLLSSFLGGFRVCVTAMESAIGKTASSVDTKLRGRVVVVNEEAVAAACHLVDLIRSEGVHIPETLTPELSVTTIGAMTISYDVFMDAVQCGFNKLYNLNEEKLAEQLQRLPDKIVIQCEKKQALAKLSTRLQKLMHKHAIKTVTQCLDTASVCKPENNNLLQKLVVQTYGAALSKAFELANAAIKAALPHDVNEFERLYKRRNSSLKPPACGRGLKRTCVDEQVNLYANTRVRRLNQDVQAAVLKSVQVVLQASMHKLTPLRVQECVEKADNVLTCVQQLMLQQTSNVYNQVAARLPTTCHKAVTQYLTPA